MLVLMDCGTPRIFEEAKYNYVFRTAAHATMDNVGLIRYMKAKNIKMDTLSAINQDYAWGQDSRADFIAAAGQLYPDAKLQTDLLPKFGAGQYGTEISAERLAIQGLRGCERRLSGAGRLSHHAIDPRAEGGCREGHGQERWQETFGRRIGRGHDRAGMAIARRPHTDEARRRSSGDPADCHQPH